MDAEVELMKRMLIVAAVLSAAVGVVVAQDQAKAELKDAMGQTVGEAVLTDTPHGVLIHATLTNVPPGVHAFHIHQTGKCEPPFTTAGGHFNPDMKQHGITNPMGMHAWRYAEHRSARRRQADARRIGDPGFGRVFSDHMAVIRYNQAEGWHGARVECRDNFTLDPATAMLHYAQEISKA